MNTKNKNFSQNSLWSLVGSVVNACLGIIYIVLIGNIWGSEGLGIFSVGFSLFLTSSMIFNFGLQSSMVYFIASHSEDRQKAGEFLSTGIFESVLLGVFGAVLGLFFSEALAGLFNLPVLTAVLESFCIALPLLILNKTFQGFYNGIHDLKTIAFAQVIRAVVVLSLMSVAASQKDELAALAKAFIWGESGVLVFYCVKYLFYYSLHLPKLEQLKSLTSYGWKAGFTGMIGDLNTRLDILMIGFFCEPSIVGFYSFAVSIAKGLWILPGAIQRVTNPLIVVLYKQKKFDQIKKLLDSLLALGIPVFLIGGVSLSLLAPNITAILYPLQPEMVHALPPLLILMPGSMLFATLTMIGSAPTSSIGQPENALKLILITLVSNFFLNLLLIPLFAGSGAALATSISTLVIFTTLKIYSQKFLNYHFPMKKFGLQVILLCLLSALLLEYPILFEHGIYQLVLFIIWVAGTWAFRLLGGSELTKIYLAFNLFKKKNS